MSGDHLNLDAILARGERVAAIAPADRTTSTVYRLGREDVPALVAEVRRLRAEVSDLRLSLAAEDDDDEPFPMLGES